jgi:hypothetical protein
MIQHPPESTEVAESTESDCLLYPVPYTVYHSLLYRITNAGGQPRESTCPTELILGGTGQFTARPLARIPPVPVSLDWRLTSMGVDLQFRLKESRHRIRLFALGMDPQPPNMVKTPRLEAKLLGAGTNYLAYEQWSYSRTPFSVLEAETVDTDSIHRSLRRCQVPTANLSRAR